MFLVRKVSFLTIWRCLAGERGHSAGGKSLFPAGEEAGSSGVLGMGIAAGSVGLSGLMQEAPEPKNALESEATDSSDLVAQLQSLKKALDAGLIDQAEFDAAKAKALGLA